MCSPVQAGLPVALVLALGPNDCRREAHIGPGLFFIGGNFLLEFIFF